MKKLLILICVLLTTGCVTLGKDIRPMTADDYMKLAEQTRGSKTTALSANTTPVSTDIMYLVDDPGGTPASNKITLASLFDTQDVIGKKSFEDEDWGDISVSSNSVTLDADVVAAAEMADADHGMGSWSSGVLTIEDFALNTDADAGDNDITSLDKLEGVDSGQFIDLGTTNQIIYSCDGAGTPFATPDHDFTGTSYFDDDMGLLLDKKILFGDTGVYIFSNDDSFFDSVADGGWRFFDAVNNGDPVIQFGAAAAEALIITGDLGAGDQLLDSIEFATATSQGGADAGKFIFDVDGTDIAIIDDGGINPASANTQALGDADAEWGDLYLGDSGVIYGQSDQSNTLTSSATGWTANLNFSVIDDVYDSGWNADTGSPQKDDIYDYLHQMDADDDGSFIDESWFVLTNFTQQTAWRIFYSDTNGDVTELALGAANTFLGSDGTTSAPSFQALIDADIPSNIDPDKIGTDGASNNKVEAANLNIQSVDLTCTSAYIPVGNASNKMACVAMSGVTTIDNTGKVSMVDSVVWNAAAMNADGTQCADPAEVTINSGPITYSSICTDNDGSTLYGHVIMPDGWNAGTVTFELEYVQTAADTNVLNSDICAMCRGAGETINNTWGTEVAIDDAAVTGSNAVDHATSGAVTANGTCAAGDTLFWRWQLDAGGTTTAVATLHILGIKMEFTENASD